MSIPTLMFAEGGWCEAIKESYAPGPYQPKSAEEFNALAPFAVDPPALEEESARAIVPPDFDLDACEDAEAMKSYANAQGIKFHARAGLDKIREAIKAALEAQAKA